MVSAFVPYMVMIADAMKQFQLGRSQTIVVVAPRILLANQLCAEFTEFSLDADIMHVHSGETHYFSSTKAEDVKLFVSTHTKHKIIFTTYHSKKGSSDMCIKDRTTTIYAVQHRKFVGILSYP